MRAKVRLYVESSLGGGQSVILSREQAHYLFTVMRLREGGAVALFNGRDGEWLAEIAESGRRGGILSCRVAAAPQVPPPDVWLLFAPVKKARTDFIVEKATEIGAARLIPVITERTSAERVRVDRLQARAVEAAEQCGATFVPQVAEPEKLERMLVAVPSDRQLMFCDEKLRDQPVSATFDGAVAGPWAILIGPEGGFSESETRSLRAHPQSVAVSLGPRILRAETAAIAALTLWHATFGDWR